ncbi:potassium channel family protein [Castellaniella ginsengisoli]|uniref:Potassium channel family protein n=1 Tax=Castellaniella ginsengisoli TaxID=546114 RepID=A0AB39D5K4_9BURK
MYVNKQDQNRLVIKLVTGFAVAVASFGFAYFWIGFLPGNGLQFSGRAASFSECFYFSVVTITTLGYGDVTPLGFAKLIASGEAIFGLIYVGYAISQVVSFKQEALISYLANDRIIQTYDLCLSDIADAKEMIADRRRAIQAKHPVNKEEYFYFRMNPFYAAFKAMRVLIGYTTHIEHIAKAGEMSERIERAAHHVEEVAGFTRKLVNIIISEKIDWKTDRTVMLLTELCETIETFAIRFTKHTKYAKLPYKGGGLYIDVITDITNDIRGKLPGETIKYKDYKSRSATQRRISRAKPNAPARGLTSGSTRTRTLRVRAG